MNFRSIIPFSRNLVPTFNNTEAEPFTSLRREMDRLFDSFTRDWSLPARSSIEGLLSPAVDIVETEKGLEILAELPGIDQKDIHVDITSGVLTLKAESRSQKDEKDGKKQYHLVERSYGTYLRRFSLPFEADESKIEATFDKGVLKVKVPRSVEAAKQAKKIEVKAA